MGVDVTTGHRWFTWLCQKMGVDPIKTFRQEVSANFHGKIKGPFNAEDRLKAVRARAVSSRERWHHKGEQGLIA